MIRRRKILQGASSLALLSSISLVRPIYAQDFPNHRNPIRLVVGYTAGGSSDFIARTLAEQLAIELSNPVIVDNKPGGSTVVAAAYVARAAPDGHTLFQIGDLTHSSLSSLHKDLSFDPIKSFVPITVVEESPLVISIRPDLPINTLQELISYAKEHPNELTFGSAGVGNTLHLAGEVFQDVAGIKLSHIPYKGASQAIVDLVAGRIDLMIDLPQTPLPYIREGKLRALAVTSTSRLDVLPEVPTTTEAGLGDYTFASRIGYAAPAGTPNEVIDILFKAINAATAVPEVKEKFERQSMIVSPSESPQAFANELAQTAKMVSEILERSGVEPT